MLTSQSLAAIGIHAAFSDATDGGVRDEYDVLAEHIAWRAGFSLPLYQCKQLHGDAVWWVEWGRAGQGADILISRQRNLTLAIRTADCLPILLADAGAGVIAAVHAGWRGTVANVAAKAVATMVELGADLTAIHADFGPAIASCCFAVNGDCSRQLQQVAGGVGVTTVGEQQAVSLVEINRWQLEQAGVNAAHISNTAPCSCCAYHYFSHRRDQSPWRQVALIAL
ncbi:MAG: polyphenol oxidase family protein [Mariprofundales bacterium]